MRCRLLVLALALLGASVPPASAQVSVGIGISAPGVHIGIDVPAYPELVRVPQYPVYYAPSLPANYFFYDGLYWVYVDDAWYSSSWYNGPWLLVQPAVVPIYLLRVPVRYYRAPPPYFRAWAPAAPPRWDAHWGPGWAQNHRDWMRVDPHRAAPAPLPVYQRSYAGGRYPDPARQREIAQQQYRFQPRDPQVRRVWAQAEPRNNTPAGRATQPRPPARDEALAQRPERPAPQVHQRPRPEPAVQPPQAQRQPHLERERAEPPRQARHEPQRPAEHGRGGPAQEAPRQARGQERRDEGRGEGRGG